MDGQLLLKKINNQCAAVQTAISIYYETPENERLTNELKHLKKTLDEYISCFLQET